MARFVDRALSREDVLEFLRTESDFGFELRILQRLTRCGFHCHHSGSYQDPVTGKTRQFDIQAVRREQQFSLYVAVECKNLSRSYPLVALCVPRARGENYYTLVRSVRPSNDRGIPPALVKRCDALHVPAIWYVYAERDPVAKSMTRVGRSAEKDGGILTGDGDVFEKWSQALSSAEAFGDQVVADLAEQGGVSLLLPALVVPDNALWMASYNNDGTPLREPELVHRVSLYVGKECTLTDQVRKFTYTLSHLEVVTETGLRELFENMSEENIRRDLQSLNL